MGGSSGTVEGLYYDTLMVKLIHSEFWMKKPPRSNSYSATGEESILSISVLLPFAWVFTNAYFYNQTEQ